MSGGCVFCPREEFSPWIWYKIVFSGNLGDFTMVRCKSVIFFLRALCQTVFFAKIRNLFIWIWIKYTVQRCFLWTGMFFYHRYYLSLAFLYIWANLLREWCPGAVFSVHMGNFFPWIWNKTVFSVHMRIFSILIWFSDNSAQIYHVNYVRGLCSLSICVFSLNMV